MAAIGTDAPADLGPAVIAVCYVFIVITILIVVGRTTISLLRKRTLGTDDILLIIATPLGLLSAICMATAVVNGLGRSIATVHSGQLSRYFQLTYAANLFTFFAMAATKHSVIAFIQRLMAPSSRSRRYLMFLHPVVVSWLLFSVFGIAFQCGLPAPWIYQPGRCAGQGAIWFPIVVVSMIIDIILAFGFLPIIRGVQLDAKKKSRVMSMFLARLAVPVFSIAFLATLAPALTDDDQTRAITVPTIMAQMEMNVSIITAALLALSRTLTSLEPPSSATVVSEIAAVPLDSAHSRTTSDENNKLRDWAFAQLRNTPTPNSMKDVSMTDLSQSPQKPEKAQLPLQKLDTPPAIPPRSSKRSPSPRLTLNFAPSDSDVRNTWLSHTDSNRSSQMTQLTIEGAQRVSQRLS